MENLNYVLICFIDSPLLFTFTLLFYSLCGFLLIYVFFLYSPFYCSNFFKSYCFAPIFLLLFSVFQLFLWPFISLRIFHIYQIILSPSSSSSPSHLLFLSNPSSSYSLIPPVPIPMDHEFPLFICIFLSLLQHVFLHSSFFYSVIHRFLRYIPSLSIIQFSDSSFSSTARVPKTKNRDRQKGSKRQVTFKGRVDRRL